MQTPFSPVPSIAPYFISDKFQNFAVGPVGSTKTTASIIKIAYEASQVAKSRDGKRRSRYVVVRNTRQQLLDSTIKDWLKWFPDGVAGSFMKTDLTYHLKFNDVESEVMFRGLDDTNDVRRLLSLQLTGAFMDEFREINQEIFEALTGRLGRYPDGMLVPHRPQWGVDKKGKPIQGCVNDAGKHMARLWGSTNAPDMDTYWYEYLTNPPENCSVTIQPGGLTQEADWTHLLDSEYYERVSQGKSQEWIDVYINAKWGSSLSGKPVFRSFDADLHIAKTPLRPIKSITTPLIVGMDFGLNPSAIVCQMDTLGRLLVFKALTSSGMGVLRFIQTILRPCLITNYPGMHAIVVGDPAGTQRAQTDEKSCYDILKREGFKAIPASTNALGARIAAVDSFLMRQVAGQTGILIDPEASLLIRALRGAYRYKIKKSGEQEDSPEKNEASHIADAFEYACLHADGGLRGTLLGTTRKLILPVQSGGWT